MKRILLIVIAVLSLSAVARADSFRRFNSRAGQNPTDFIDLSQLGPTGTILSTPQVVSTFEGNAALVGNINGTSFLRVDEGNGWRGNFDYGENLIWTGNSSVVGVGGIGPMGIALENPVGSFGFEIQTDLYGPFTATVEAFDINGHLLFGSTFSGHSNGLENGSALFVGLGDTTGVNISEILISTSSGNPQFANDFAIDDPSFTYTTATATPEPSSMFLMGSSLAVLAGILRRKLSV